MGNWVRVNSCHLSENLRIVTAVPETESPDTRDLPLPCLSAAQHILRELETRKRNEGEVFPLLMC